MSKTIKSEGGITVRFIEALNGFKTKHGYWPEAIEAEAATISSLATEFLTPLGFFLLQSKVELRAGREGKLVAFGRGDDVFGYGDEGCQQPDGHKHDACAWLGLGE